MLSCLDPSMFLNTIFLAKKTNSPSTERPQSSPRFPPLTHPRPQNNRVRDCRIRPLAQRPGRPRATRTHPAGAGQAETHSVAGDSGARARGREARQAMLRRGQGGVQAAEADEGGQRGRCADVRVWGGGCAGQGGFAGLARGLNGEREMCTRVSATPFLLAWFSISLW